MTRIKTKSGTTSFLLKLLSLVPTVLLLFLIFGFSAQDGESSGSLSFEISLFFVKLASPFLPAAMSEEVLLERAELIHYFVRKAAHMTEYFLLTLSLQLPLAAWFSDKLAPKLRIVIGLQLPYCLPPWMSSIRPLCPDEAVTLPMSASTPPGHLSHHYFYYYSIPYIKKSLPGNRQAFLYALCFFFHNLILSGVFTIELIKFALFL